MRNSLNFPIYHSNQYCIQIFIVIIMKFTQNVNVAASQSSRTANSGGLVVEVVMVLVAATAVTASTSNNMRLMNKWKH